MLTEALIALFLAISLDPAVRILMQANKLLASLPGKLSSGAVGFTRATFSTLASTLLSW